MCVCGSELIPFAEDDDAWRSNVSEIFLYYTALTSSTRFSFHHSTRPTEFARNKETSLPSLFRSNFELERRTKKIYNVNEA